MAEVRVDNVQAPHTPSIGSNSRLPAARERRMAKDGQFASWRRRDALELRISKCAWIARTFSSIRQQTHAALFVNAEGEALAPNGRATVCTLCCLASVGVARALRVSRAAMAAIALCRWSLSSVSLSFSQSRNALFAVGQRSF